MAKSHEQSLKTPLLVTAGLFCLSAITFAAPPKDVDCITAKIQSGNDCHDMVAQVNVDKCGEKLGDNDVHATCWNQKPVFVVKGTDKKYTATFEKHKSWGNELWQLTGQRSEDLGNGETRTETDIAPVQPEASDWMTHVKKSHKSKIAKAASIATPEVPKPQPAHVAIASINESREPAQESTAKPVETAPAPKPAEPAPTAPQPATTTDPFKDIKANAYLDLYYMYSLNRPGSVSTPYSTPKSAGTVPPPTGNVPLRVYDTFSDDIKLNMFDILIQKKKGPIAAVVDLAFGHIPDSITGSDDISKYITQATLAYTPTDLPSLTLTGGKMFTHMGTEVVRTKDNWNYSRSFLFGYAIPVWHYGASLAYAWVPSRVTTTAYVYTNSYSSDPEYEPRSSKSYGFQAVLSPADPITLTYNFLTGPGDGTLSTDTSKVRMVHEAILSWNPTSQLSFAADSVFGSQTNTMPDGSTGRWWAASIAAKLALGSFSISPRYEYYDDSDGVTLPTTNSLAQYRLTSSTVTVSYDTGADLELRLEYRNDWGSKSVFTGADGLTASSQDTITLGALYSF